MTNLASDIDVERRLVQLEEMIERVDRRWLGLDDRLRRLEKGGVRTVAMGSGPRPVALGSVPPIAQQPLPLVAPPPELGRVTEPPAPIARLLGSASPGDLIGGRGLAWLGGIAILAGTILFLALAISHGWIGREARVVLAAIGSAALVAGGGRLHARRGRTEAAVAMVGAGTAGIFATSIVAAEVYALVPPLVAVAASLVAGAVATALAIRWAGRAIGALGLLGALISPVLVGAPASGGTVAVLGVAAACAVWVVVWQRWAWLAFATIAIAAPQWGGWLLTGHTAIVDLVTLVMFTAVGLVGAIGTQLRAVEPDRPVAAAIALLSLNAVTVAVVGRFALLHDGGTAASALWLVALAVVHAAVGLSPAKRVAIARPVRRLALAIAVVLADVAFGLTASGIALAAGWALAALACTWLVRRAEPGGADATMLTVGVGGHIGLVLMRTLIAAPPTEFVAGAPAVEQLMTVALLAGSCIAGGRLAPRGLVRTGLDLLGLGAVAYLTAGALDGNALIAAWACEAVALERIGRRSHDRLALGAAACFLGGAILYALAVEAPPSGLVTGVPSVGAAAIAVGIVIAAFVLLARGRERSPMLAAAAVAALYLASVAIVSAFQPADSAASDTVLDLGVRQQGQVLLSVMWSAVGLAGLVAGLRMAAAPLRHGALALLLLSVGKVFMYDLSTLTSIYRVISFVVLGLLLLAGAFAYQRLRPPPMPDMRTVHPSQR